MGNLQENRLRMKAALFPNLNLDGSLKNMFLVVIILQYLYIYLSQAINRERERGREKEEEINSIASVAPGRGPSGGFEHGGRELTQLELGWVVRRSWSGLGLPPARHRVGWRPC